jgi:hypothetical protein
VRYAVTERSLCGVERGRGYANRPRNGLNRRLSGEREIEMAKTGRNEMRRSLSGEVSSRLDTISLTLAKPSAYAVGD